MQQKSDGQYLAHTGNGRSIYGVNRHLNETSKMKISCSPWYSCFP